MIFEEEVDDVIRKSFQNEDEEKLRKATFCGTAEYVSPEMLKGDQVEIAADYWALGCIIYNLIVGNSPFKDKSQYMVFQNIKCLKIDYPPSIPSEAFDIISKLLVHSPENRIGNNAFSEISEHEFFFTEEGVNLVQFIYSIPVPNKKSFVTPKSQLEGKKQGKEENEAKNKMLKKVFILKEEIVEKKSPYLHYNTRKLTLDSTPKLEYKDPSTGVVKGVIYLSKECSAELISYDRFNLNTAKRVFIFKVGKEEAGVWCKLINDQIADMEKQE